MTLEVEFISWTFNYSSLKSLTSMMEIKIEMQENQVSMVWGVQLGGCVCVTFLSCL